MDKTTTKTNQVCIQSHVPYNDWASAPVTYFTVTPEAIKALRSIYEKYKSILVGNPELSSVSIQCPDSLRVKAIADYDVDNYDDIDDAHPFVFAENLIEDDGYLSPWCLLVLWESSKEENIRFSWEYYPDYGEWKGDVIETDPIYLFTALDWI